MGETPMTASAVAGLGRRAPAALCTKQNQSSARALKAVLGLDTLERWGGRTPVDDTLLGWGESPAIRTGHLAQTNTEIRDQLVGQLLDAGSVDKRFDVEPLADIVSRWRTAEIATLEYLNSRGWRPEDVSGQNVEYHLSGSLLRAVNQATA
jgi:hypothetical protein